MARENLWQVSFHLPKSERERIEEYIEKRGGVSEYFRRLLEEDMKANDEQVNLEMKRGTYTRHKQTA